MLNRLIDDYKEGVQMKKLYYIILSIALCIPFFSCANFIWPAIGMQKGFLNLIFLSSIMIGLVIEFLFLRSLLPTIPVKTVACATLIMNIASSIFGIVFVSLIDLSLQHMLGIAWLWHMVILYVVMVVANICIEGFICLQFWPQLDKQQLLRIIALANAISVAIALVAAKAF